MAALQGAVTLAKMHGVTLAIAHNLYFDVARAGQIFLKVQGIVAEGRLDSARAVESALGKSSSVRATFIPRPPPPAAAFTSTGKPISRAIRVASSLVVTAPGEPGTTGMPSFLAVSLAWICPP